MLHAIQNQHLTVTVNDHGAELWSIRDAAGKEYLWQGDPAYWEGRSPNLFPYIGRMIGKQYTYHGTTYPMDIHGIVLYSPLTLVEKDDIHMIFELESDAKTLQQYPWAFRYRVIYRLEENRLHVTFEVTNCDKTEMLFAVGGHPGFLVPFDGGAFEDYSLRFSAPSQPERVVFTDDCFVESFTEPYSLVNGTDIPLRHDLFDNDAIVLKGTSGSVSIVGKGDRSVTVSYPQMDYIGFWHQVKSDAPYVCVEPWSSLPSPKGEKTVLETQKDLLKLEAGCIYENSWSITID